MDLAPGTGLVPAGFPGTQSVNQRRNLMSTSSRKPMSRRSSPEPRGAAPGREGRSTTSQRLPLTGRIAGMAARRPWRTLGLWVVLLAFAYFAAGLMNLTPSPGTAGTDATRAKDLIDQRLRQQTPPEEFIVVESQATTADAAAYASFVDALVRDLRALDVVSSVTSY